MSVDDRIAGRLKEAREAAGYASAAEAARALSVPVPTYAGHENGSRGSPARRAAHYARRFRISLEWLLTGKGDASQISQIEPALISLPVLGEVQAGAWRDVEEINPVEAEHLPVAPALVIQGARQYWVQVIGNSVNERIPDGGFALCCAVWDWARDADDLIRRGAGRLVLCRRERPGLVEVTIKQLVVTNGTPALHTVSTDPKYRNARPLPLNETGDTDGAVIVAVVTGAQMPV